ncbi:hypothetical protein ACOSQ4_002765 [Xanthoceras sorbifolium]
MDCRSGASFLGLSSSKSRCKFLWGTNIPPKFRRNHFVHSGVLFEAVDSVGWAAQLLFAHPSGGSSSSQSWLPPASSCIKMNSDAASNLRLIRARLGCWKLLL